MAVPGTSYDDGRVETLRADDSEGRFPPSAYKRPDGRVLEDVSEALFEGPFDASAIEVSVAGGEVTLEGAVPSPADPAQAEKIAEAVRGVRAVHNHLLVRAFPDAPR